MPTAHHPLTTTRDKPAPLPRCDDPQHCAGFFNSTIQNLAHVSLLIAIYPGVYTHSWCAQLAPLADYLFSSPSEHSDVMYGQLASAFRSVTKSVASEGGGVLNPGRLMNALSARVPFFNDGNQVDCLLLLLLMSLQLLLPVPLPPLLLLLCMSFTTADALDKWYVVQHDAHELLRFLLDGLNDEISESMKQVNSKGQSPHPLMVTLSLILVVTKYAIKLSIPNPNGGQ